MSRRTVSFSTRAAWHAAWRAVHRMIVGAGALIDAGTPVAPVVHPGGTSAAALVHALESRDIPLNP